MKVRRFLKKAVFFALIGFISFALVASHGMTNHKLMANIQNQQDCLMTYSLGKNGELTQRCTNIPQEQYLPLQAPKSLQPQFKRKRAIFGINYK
jgi:hypothetical protein